MPRVCSGPMPRSSPTTEDARRCRSTAPSPPPPRLDVTRWHLSLSHDAASPRPSSSPRATARPALAGSSRPNTPPAVFAGRDAGRLGVMRDAYQVAKVRAAEAKLMALSPMARLCSERRRGSPRSARACCASVRAGSTARGGDPGRDRRQRRGRPLRRRAAGPAGRGGDRDPGRARPARGRRGGRCGPRAARPRRRAAPRARRHPARPGRRYDAGRDARHAIGHADLIIDGLLGIGGRGGLREPFATPRSSRPTRPGPRSRSTCPAASTRTPARSRAGSAGRRHGHVRHVQAGAADRSGQPATPGRRAGRHRPRAVPRRARRPSARRPRT